MYIFNIDVNVNDELVDINNHISMLMNKLFNPVFKTVARPQFYFSASKNKSIELTLRTPYSIKLVMKKLLSRILLASAKLLLKTFIQLLLSKTDHHLLFMFFLLDHWDWNWLEKWRELLTNTSTQADGQQFTRICCIMKWQFSLDQFDGCSRKERRESWPNW